MNPRAHKWVFNLQPARLDPRRWELEEAQIHQRHTVNTKRNDQRVYFYSGAENGPDPGMRTRWWAYEVVVTYFTALHCTTLHYTATLRERSGIDQHAHCVCTRESAEMSMRVHNSDHFEELRQCALSASGSPRRSQLGSNGRNSFEFSLRSLSPSNPSRKGSYASELSRETQMKRVAMKHELYLKEQEAMQKKLTEGIAENLQKQKTKKEAQYLKLWKEIEDGKALAEELHEKLELQEQSKNRQFQRMHDEWTTGVFQKLNEPVLSKVQAMDGKELSLSKHETYQRFLDITNKKGGLFRDIIIESEYNPLNDVKFLSHRVKVDDPVKRVIHRREEEDAIARDGVNLPREPHDGGATSTQQRESVGRGDNLDVKLWSKGVFESTPYGYFHKMMNSTASSDSSKTYASRVKLDHYDVETGLEALRRELPKGKRTNFDGYTVVPKTTIQLS